MLAILGNDAQYYPHFIDKKFPHVMRRIVDLWAQAQLDKLLNGLLAPSGPGCIGFPRQVLMEIVGIRHLLRQRMEASGIPLDDPLPIRDVLWTLVDFEQENYPIVLERQYPHLLPEILSHLGLLQFNARIDALLAPSRQRELNLSEAAMIELMTLKAMHLARYFPKEKPLVDVSDSHLAAQAAGVFDRFHRH